MSGKLRSSKTVTILFTLAGVLLVLLYLAGKNRHLLSGQSRLTPAPDSSIESVLKRAAADRRQERFQLLLAVLAATILMLIGLGFAAKHTHLGAVQHDRDLRAEEIERKVRAGEYPEGYCLYLRPFSSTGRFEVSNPERWSAALGPSPMAISRFDVPFHLELEQVLSDALAPLPLIALGRPGEHYGAGRLASDDDWQAVFARLTLRATALLVMPSAEKGILWEIQWLRKRGLHGRCVFLMPPAPGNRRKALHLERAWREASRALEEVGIHLPEYRASGLLFTLDARGRLHERAPLSLTSEESLKGAVRSLIGKDRLARNRPGGAGDVIHLPANLPRD